MFLSFSRPVNNNLLVLDPVPVAAPDVPVAVAAVAPAVVVAVAVEQAVPVVKVAVGEDYNKK